MLVSVAFVARQAPDGCSAAPHPSRLDADGQPTGEPALVLGRASPAVALVADELLVFGGEARGETVADACSADLSDLQARSPQPRRAQLCVVGGMWLFNEGRKAGRSSCHQSLLPRCIVQPTCRGILVTRSTCGLAGRQLAGLPGARSVACTPQGRRVGDQRLARRDVWRRGRPGGHPGRQRRARRA
jgi:hypothetical protein